MSAAFTLSHAEPAKGGRRRGARRARRSARGQRLRRLPALVPALVLALVLAPVLVLLPLVVAPVAPAGAAADANDFRAGMIIADEVFFAPQAMTAAEVQAFLSEKGAECVPSSSGVPCLKDYRETTPNRPATEFCRAYAGAINELAAQIIDKSAQACGINPQALIVILQKEQSLVTASGAELTETRYRSAMGFRCPTNLPCEPQYAGFANQVYFAASRFQEYADYPGRFTFRAGQDNTIPYHPDPACGSSVVFIRNQATAGLYNYTPFQPNQAALDAGYGTGDACSAYGNRNFWLRFQDWFGPTEGEAYNPFGRFDSLTAAPGALRLRGWAIDPDTSASIFVWVTIDGVGRHLVANVSRPDVGAAYPQFGSAHGFDATINVPPGAHRVCVTASNVDIGRHTGLGCRTASPLTGSPFGNLERLVGVAEGIHLKGWAIDPDTSASIYLWVTVDGAGRHVLANRSRGDVGAAFPLYGPAHGFEQTIPASPGTHRVCVTASNVGAGSHTNLGCRDVTTTSASPFGNFERAAAVPGGIDVRGWAIDPNTASPIYVWVTIDGVGRHLYADRERGDVGRAFPAYGSAHGFAAVLPASAGAHRVCVTASNVGPGSHTGLGCRAVTTP